ncbi:MAG: hypothetical protein ACXAAT_06660, partial [Candidatus Hodarchaeales archaeon]
DLDSVPRLVREMEKKQGILPPIKVDLTAENLFNILKCNFTPNIELRWTGVIKFNIPEDPFSIKVINENLRFEKEKMLAGDLVITSSKEDLYYLLEGDLHPEIAVTSGIIQVNNENLGRIFWELFLKLDSNNFKI